MALPATIFKVQLSISDIDRGYYADHSLTLARHPSETDERMMMRLLAFIFHADEALNFTRGLCVDHEPDLWRKDLTGDIALWLEVGLPDERRVRKACSRAQQVAVYAYGGRAVDLWWQKNAAGFARHKNLQVMTLAPETCSALTGLARRSMELTCTLQDGQAWLHGAGTELSLIPVRLQ
ncbi:MAG: YaeQ family protein [Desulfuromonadales bacterium]|nr:YaeQ family protein [Desulfuromonadales bacterium]